MKMSRTLVWSIAFLVSMIAFSATVTPLTVRVEYYYPCRDLNQVKSILPLVCASGSRVVFKLVNTTLVAEVEGVEFRVAEPSPKEVRVHNKELWILFLACCEARIPPQRHVDITSIAMGVAVASLLSVITACTVTYVLARRTRKH